MNKLNDNEAQKRLVRHYLNLAQDLEKKQIYYGQALEMLQKIGDQQSEVLTILEAVGHAESN